MQAEVTENVCQDESILPPKAFKSAYKPIWCPGCGDYAVLTAITKALSALGLKRENTAIVSGIGCSSRIPAYTSVYGFHGVHGRALALATGLKIARPDLTVLVTGGDGDGFSIGGNHFLHACRRNVDLTYVVMDNQVYGMTKGQASPTTASTWVGSKLTPHGTGVSPFQPMAVALAAGANFIARGYSGDPNGVAKLVAEAVEHPGFSVVQVLSQCVTYRPEQRDWKGMVRKTNKEPTSNLARAGRRILDDDGFTTGIFYLGNRPAYVPTTDSDRTVAEIEQRFAV
ncbi:MAG: 2-oxoacid:ferredoxin oxidoreductase subunit beta [Rhodospirillales bacterium]|nr:2-oxoacid:ferredoxin oxidoreductase subunit beta [Rhodospirillales bacterium]